MRTREQPANGGGRPQIHSNLAVGFNVAIGLVRGLEIRPRYIVANGGGTASEIGTRALGIDRAVILGQAVPRVPVWRLGLESDFPGMIFVPLPGNVGGAEALADVVRALDAKAKS